MTDKNNGGPAFPTVAGQTVYSNGMTLRDYFAAQALANVNAESYEEAALLCYGVADAMLRAREE